MFTSFLVVTEPLSSKPKPKINSFICLVTNIFTTGMFAWVDEMLESSKTFERVSLDVFFFENFQVFGIKVVPVTLFYVFETLNIYQCYVKRSYLAGAVLTEKDSYTLAIN